MEQRPGHLLGVGLESGRRCRRRRVEAAANKNSACNDRKIPAVASSAEARKMALCTTLRRVTTRMAEITVRVAKK
jgi:hypothetical protein